MGLKRHKLAKGLGDFVPTSINFSELEKEYDEDDQAEYDPGDKSSQAEAMLENLVYEKTVVTILCNLEPREQLVFVFQLLRDNGFQIDHNSFAKVVKLSRRQYMRILDDVRLKSWLYVQGFKNQDRLNGSHKGL